MKNRKWRLGLFPLITLLLLAAIYFHNQESLNDPDSITYTYIRNAILGRLGYGAAGDYRNMINLSDLEPGDIILGGYPQCAYGRFSHAGIYIGDGQVIEGYVDMGITRQPVEHYWSYSEVCLLKIKASAAQKQAAVEYAQNHLGELFYPVAFKPGERIWNCTKIVWEAYRQQGIDLSVNKDIWISPDEFYQSPHVQIIREISVP
jgi:uncharacterized protein YycO